ncbi:hypothetical protein BH10PSE17_BH10PSE17_21500 [soil metagenome]
MAHAPTRRLAARLAVAAAFGCALVAEQAWAADPTVAAASLPDPRLLASRLSEQYPSGSIQDEATADRARADAVAAQKAISWAGYDREVACQSRFAVTPCVEAARREQLRASWAAKDVELEANSFVRRKRDEEYLERKAREMAEADAQTQRMAEQHVADQAAYKKSLEPPPAPVPRTQRPAPPVKALTPEEQAANRAAFERKQQDAADHQKEIEQRQANRVNKAGQPPATAP